MKIKSKLLFSILPTVLIVFASLTYLSYSTSRKALISEIKQRAESMLYEYVTELDGRLLRYEKVAEGLGSACEGMQPTSEEAVKNTIQKFLNNEPQVYGSTVSFVPGSFSSEKELVGPYYHRSNKALEYVDLGRPSYNYPKWDWFKKAVDTKLAFWTEPYIDYGGGSIAMTTYSHPFSKGDNVWGVATVDVSLKQLTDVVEKIRAGSTGHAFLISKTGVFLSMRRGEWNLNKTIFDAAKEFSSDSLKKLADEMTAGGSGLVKLYDPLIDKISWVSYGQVPSTGWSLAIVLPEDELMKELVTLHHRIIFIVIVGALLIATIIFFTSARITKPISNLASAATSFAVGNPNVRLPECRSRDEVGELTLAIGNMLNSLSRTMDDLRDEREIFSTAFQNISDGILIINSTWHVLESNNAAKEILGTAVEGSLLKYIENHFISTLPLAKLEFSSEREIPFELKPIKAEASGPARIKCRLYAIFGGKGHPSIKIMNLSKS